MKHDQLYWEERYLNHSTGWNLGHVSRPLKEIINSIENKSIKILIPGAGNAYEACYLIDCGFNDITVLDIASQPIQALKERFKNNSNITIIQGDFFNHIGNYDLILEQTFFCALGPRLRENYIEKTYDLLNKEGNLQGVLFDFEPVRSEPPYSGSKIEYQNMFEKKFEILQMERCINSEDKRKGKELIINLKKK